MDVKIQLADSTSEELSVVHFADENDSGSVVDSSTDGQTVSFNAEGFSIYAVVDGNDGENARIGYRFWYNDGTQNVLLATQYFRYKDLHTDNLDAILSLHEPSIPGIDSAAWARIFEGWSKTSTSDEAANLLTIDQLNTELSAKSESDFVEGTLVDVYANLKNVYYVTYVDVNPNNVLATEIVPVEESGDTKFNIKSAAELRPTIDSDTTLLGWYDIDNPETVYTPGQENVVVTANTTLYPKVEGGYWLVFNDNDPVWDVDKGQYVSGGASFTPPAFYLNENTEQPADPTWTGYEFGGWYTDAACTTSFEFGSELTHDTTVYAKWIPSSSSYRVIIWKQRKTDSVDAADDGKTYDYYDSYLVDTGVQTGELVTLDSSYTTLYGTSYSTTKEKDETGERKDGFHYNAGKSDQSVVVKADGSSVLNVYYDRNAYTLKFYFAKRASNGSTYQVTSGSNRYSYYYSMGSFSNAGTNLTSLCVDGDQSNRDEYNNTYYYYYPLRALYGANISDLWPEYSLFPYTSGSKTKVISYALMEGAEASTASSSGGNTVKGKITTMDEQVLGRLNDADGNFLWVRFSEGNNWLYYVWQEQLPDTDYSGYTVSYTDHNNNSQTVSNANAVKTVNGVDYFLKEVVLVRSNGTKASDQHAPSYTGFEKVSETFTNLGNSNYRMDYYYTRKDYTLTFYTNNSSNQLMEETVPYEASLSEYGDQSPGQKPGHYFLGWYADPGCTEPFDFTQSMPDSNMAVYGNWKLRRVRIVIEPGANNVYMGSQATRFRVDYDENIDGGLMESAQRAGYILDGWYTDPEFTNRFLFSDPINDDIEDVDWTYQEEHWRATRIAYGDDDEAHSNVRGILHLYAKWILDTTSTGINVVYDPGDAAVYDSLGNLVTTVPVDPHMYGFDGTATAREAPSNYSDLYSFRCWEATLSDGNKVEFYAGSSINLAALLPQDIVYDENDEELRHTVVLRAVYDLVGDPARQTTITYDGNTFTETMYDGSEMTLQGKSADGTQRITITLDKEVNQTIELPSADDFYLDGYELVGWSFTQGTKAQQDAGATDEAPNFTPGQQVAADNLSISELNDQNNTLYAMWQPKKYTVTVKQVVEDGVPVSSFTYVYRRGAENNIGNAADQTQLLSGNSSFSETDFGYYERVGDVIRITTPVIPANASYDVRVNAVVTRDDGTTQILNPTTAGDYQILGDVVITYTYAPKALVKLQKRDATNHNTVLTGAEFVLTPVELNESDQWVNAGDGQTLTVNSDTLEQYLQEGTYKISETNAPNDYAKINSDLYLTVHKEGAFSLFTANGSAVSADIAELQGTGNDEDRILTVYDNPIRTVTLRKTVDATNTEGAFTFKVTVFNSNGTTRLANTVIAAQNGTDISTNSIGEATVTLNHNQSVELKIPNGCYLTVEELANAKYKASYVWNSNASVDGNVFGGDTPVEITADGTLAFTNKLAAVRVILKKVGVNNTDPNATEALLSGAAFTAYTSEEGHSIATDANSTSLSAMTSGSNGVFFSGELLPGKYYLEETAIPAGYNAPLGRFELEVISTEEAPTIKASWITGDPNHSAGSVNSSVDAETGETVYTVTVRNIAGVSLPSTGGPGTNLIYLLGAILTALAGAGLVMRRRRRNVA